MTAISKPMLSIVAFVAIILVGLPTRSRQHPIDTIKHHIFSNETSKFHSIRSMILNGSDDLPVAVPPLVQIKIFENVTINQKLTVINIASPEQFQASPSLLLNVSSKTGNEQSRKLEFFLLNNKEEFAIDRTSGLITITRNSLSKTSYILDVQVKSIRQNSDLQEQMRKYTTRVPVIVEVVDLNREPEPLISYGTFQTHTGLRNDIPVCTIPFKDDGRGKNSLLRYSIGTTGDTPEGVFRIDETSGSIYKATTNIKPGDYIYIVSAEDNGSPPLEGSVQVRISVLDTSKVIARNDNSRPSINGLKPKDSRYTLQRNSSQLDKLIHFSIHDPELDPVFVHLTRDYGGMFAIDETSLYLAKKPDFKEEKTFNLTVMISDGASELYHNFYVHMPRFVVEIPNKVYSHNVVLDEGPVQESVPVINISEDAFEMNHTEFSLYSASSREALDAFTIEECCGIVKQTKALDYELNHHHELIFQIRDLRLPKDSYRSFANVKITLLDINDWVPIFPSESSEVEILESISIMKPFFKVKATDLDSGDNGNVTYSIVEGNHEDIFGIDRYDGNVFVRNSLDSFLEGPASEFNREVATSSTYFPLVIKASDNGLSYNLSSLFRLGVKINVPEDVPPKFNQKSYEHTVREDEKVGSVVQTFQAKSKHPIKYDILSGNDENYFSIGKYDGKFMIHKRLNHNIRSQYFFVIAATLSKPSKRILKLGLFNDTVTFKIIVAAKPVVLGDISLNNLHSTDATHSSNETIYPYNIVPAQNPTFIDSSNKQQAPNSDRPVGQNYPHLPIDSSHPTRNQNGPNHLPIPNFGYPDLAIKNSSGSHPGIETYRPFIDNHNLLKIMTVFVFGFMTVLLVIACFCLLCRCCCRSNRNKRIRSKNNNLLNRSYTSHQRLHANNADFNNSITRSMNSRISLRASSNLQTPNHIKPNHSK